MKALSVELCEHSSLHGLQHLVGRGRMAWERFLWGVLLIVVAVVTVLRVYSLWQATYEGSVVTVVENPHYDLSLVDFPAVTVCPNIKAVKTKIRSTASAYLGENMNLSLFENSVITLSLLRFPYFNLPLEFVTSANVILYPIKGEDVSDIMSLVGADLDDIMNHCKWRSVRYDCKTLFQRSLTQEGYCYSFNTKTVETFYNNSFDKYLLESTEDVIRLRSNVFGRNSGLGFRLKSLAHHNVKSDVLGDCYSIGIHNPAAKPDFYQMMTVLPHSPLKLTQISVSVATIEADSSLYNLNEAARACMLANDSSPVINCYFNCLDEIVIKQCSCLPYFRLSSQSAKPVCGVQPGQLRCLSDISHHLRFHNSCPCLNPCTDTFYTADKEELPVPSSKATDPRMWTRVRIVYKSLAVKYARTSNNDFRDFLVGCGSYASLLLGFNAVAAFDFIIYLIKLFLIFVKVFVYRIFNYKRKDVENCKPSNDYKYDFKSGGFICYKNGKRLIISKSDEFFLRTCDKKQLTRILNSNEIAYPISPFLN